jgi:hypothetical protein
LIKEGNNKATLKKHPDIMPVLAAFPDIEMQGDRTLFKSYFAFFFVVFFFSLSSSHYVSSFVSYYYSAFAFASASRPHVVFFSAWLGDG